MIDLKTRLAEAAQIWCTAHAAAEGKEVPLSRLSKAIGYDGKFFDTLPTMRRGPSTDTLEKFARFLADPANWPDGTVAEEAKALAHVCGVSAADVLPPTVDGGQKDTQISSEAA
ncbi:hypothetical protein K3172_13055 [Qipengyuania sp. 6B39]|uniref:hypothetical protein n=1 Tax=Qipengyuania proteolytica TaxID=2867239 RepID=UPI001C8A7516|nr:hypothetical protein [Qipengyuania proteolytica]MBX7496788.1 hypothetical protein [Qipengyuania proteolytica]